MLRPSKKYVNLELFIASNFGSNLKNIKIRPLSHTSKKNYLVFFGVVVAAVAAAIDVQVFKTKDSFFYTIIFFNTKHWWFSLSVTILLFSERSKTLYEQFARLNAFSLLHFVFFLYVLCALRTWTIIALHSFLHSICLVGVKFTRPSFLVMYLSIINCSLLILNIDVFLYPIFFKTSWLFTCSVCCILNIYL